MRNMNLKETVIECVREKINLCYELPDEEVYEIIDERILLTDQSSYLTFEERRRLKKEVFDALRKLDILQALIEDTEITEIMVNGTNPIFIEKNGVIEEAEVRFSSEEQLDNMIQKVVAGANRVVNTSSPIVDARLEDGSRINIVLPPVSLGGAILTIRRFPKEPKQAVLQ